DAEKNSTLAGRKEWSNGRVRIDRRPRQISNRPYRGRSGADARIHPHRIDGASELEQRSGDPYIKPYGAETYSHIGCCKARGLDRRTSIQARSASPFG